ncbi:MAG: hypothetical protein Q9202_002682 [Teloschistes flavicans]
MFIILVALLLVLLIPTPSLTYICLPTSPTPTRPDCLTLLFGLHHLSRHPPDAGAKRWGRHLPTGQGTEKLPRQYFIVNDVEVAQTCGIVVDVDDQHASVEDTFSLGDVVHAAKVVYEQCLNGPGEVGLEFVGAKGVEVRLIRVDVPHRLLRMGSGEGEEDGERRFRLPGVRGTLSIKNLETSGQGNLSQAN